MRGEPSVTARLLRIPFSRTKMETGLSAGDGGYDADFVSRFHRGLRFTEKSNVFVVQKDIHEAPDLMMIVADALFQPGIGALEAIDQLTDRCAFSLNYFLIPGEFS